MRILLVTHYFPPEVGAPQARLSELARYWANRGDDVTVLTGMPNHPTGVIPPEYRNRIRITEAVDGYRLIRTWLYATPNVAVAKRTLGHLSFMLSSVLLGARPSGPADVVVVSSPTFFSIFSAWALARLKRAHFVVEIRDLWPAIFVELGILTNKRLIKALEWLELWAYRQADAVVVVTEGFRADLLARGVPSAKVTTIMNGVDLARFHGDYRGHAELRARLGARPGDCLVLYAGAHGISQDLASIADTAALLVEEPVHFAFVGEGARKPELADRIRGLDITNATLHDSVTAREMPELLDAADICLVPLRDVPLFQSFVPSKLFECLAAGKAVIGAVRGESAAILRAAGALVIDPGDPSALAAAVRQLASDPDKRVAMGAEGRRYVAAHFDRTDLAACYRDLLLTVTS